MSITNFNTENNSYSKLIADQAVFSIPKFQRDYSWEIEEWEELWEDILASIDEKSSHYMGYLVLQNSDKNLYKVIDGQQRITTISLIILSAMYNLKNLIDLDNKNSNRLDNIRQRFIGYQDSVMLTPKNKLILNDNNNTYYSVYLVELEESLPRRNISESSMRLKKACEFFREKISQYINTICQDNTKESKGIEIAKFVEDVVSNLFFTVITVTDELNAYKVFETLNARGVQLSSTDLLKNYLFSIIDNGTSDANNLHNINVIDEQWKTIVQRLGDKKISDFLRTFWLSHYSFIRHSNLFKTIKKEITTPEQVFNLVRELNRSIDSYLFCTAPESDQLSINDSDILNYSEYIKLFKVKQHYPIIMAAYNKLDEQEFSKLIKGLYNIIFRYTVIGNQPSGDPERKYFSAAKNINEGKFKKSKDVINHLSDFYLDDKEFNILFASKLLNTKDSRNNKIAKHIYIKIEKHLSNTADYSHSDTKLNIEHIHPQNSLNNDEEIKKKIYNLGNMVLLEKSINSKCENLSFHEKVGFYRGSQLKQVEELANYENWTKEDIEKRAKILAKYAAQIWRNGE